jgi:hypothetical protein
LTKSHPLEVAIRSIGNFAHEYLHVRNPVSIYAGSVSFPPKPSLSAIHGAIIDHLGRSAELAEN